MTETTAGPRPDANDVLMGGGDGVPSAYFKTVGDSVEGVVAAPPKAREEREFNQQTQRSDGPIKTFPSGDPIYGILIDLQTQERDPMIDGDTGLRRVYAEGRQLKGAIREAVAAAGGKGLEMGGWLKVTHTGHVAVGTVQAKGYHAEYRTPAQQALMGGQAPAAAPTVAAPVAAQPAPVAAAPVVAPAPAPVAAPAAPAASPVDTARQLFAAGLSDAQIAAAVGLDAVVIAALRAQG